MCGVCLLVFFDPLGLNSPTMHMAIKILVQSLAKSGSGWDESLSENSLRKFKKWMQIFTQVARLG